MRRFSTGLSGIISNTDTAGNPIVGAGTYASDNTGRSTAPPLTAAGLTLVIKRFEGTMVELPDGWEGGLPPYWRFPDAVPERKARRRARCPAPKASETKGRARPALGEDV